MMASGFFPRRKGEETAYLDHYCHYDAGLKKYLVCPEFYFAEKSGVLVPDKHLGTWVLVGDAKRRMSAMSKYYAEGRGEYEDHTDELYARWDCYFCGGETKPIPAPRIVDCD